MKFHSSHYLSISPPIPLLSVSVLPPAPVKKSSGDSVSIGASPKLKRSGGGGQGSVSSRSTTGSKFNRRGSQSSAVSASSSMDGGAEKGEYENIVVTCHLSIDDPPFSASVMEE
jgi:hypothetical protein